MATQNARAYAHASALAALLCAAPARAQQPAPTPRLGPTRPDVREEILGFDAARRVLVYVERTPTVLAGFSHVALVEVSENGTPQRTQLTSTSDVELCRPAPPGPAPSPLAGGFAPRDGGAAPAPASSVGALPPSCFALEQRVRDRIAQARNGLVPGVSLPVLERNAGPTGACTRAPFVAREYTFGAGAEHSFVARIEPAPDGGGATLTLSAGARSAAPLSLPAGGVTSGALMARAPFDRLADVRELPGTERLAVLLRSDACTPEGAGVPAVALLLAPPPSPDEPLAALPHAELSEAAVLRAVAPRARRRDGAWYERDVLVTFDNAWTLTDERVLVQYTRHTTGMPDPLAYASFALFQQTGSRLRYLTHTTPRPEDPVRTGTGQEAFAVDLDRDGRPEVFLRTTHPPDAESGALLAYADEEVRVLWHGPLRSDERPRATGPTAQVRRCTAGRAPANPDALLLRCTLETYAQGVCNSATRVLQRLRFNGGSVVVQEERH